MNAHTFSGASDLWISKVNSISVMNGWSGVSTSGAHSGMYHVKGIQTVPSAIAQPNKKYIKGDNRVYDTYQYSADTLPTGTVEKGNIDLALNAAAQSSGVWTVGNWDIGVLGPANPTYSTMVLLAHADAHGQDDGDSRSGFENRLWANTQLTPLGGDNMTFQGEGKDRMEVSFNPFTRIPFGPDLADTDIVVEDGICLHWWSLYRTMFDVKIGDGSSTTIVVDHRPVDVASTKIYKMKLDQSTPEAAAAVTVDAVTPSTRTISTGAVTLATGYIYFVMYEASALLS